MIKAKNLSIGNHVLYRTDDDDCPGQVVEVQAADFCFLNNEGVIEKFNPIQLTDRILLNSGFGVRTDEWFFYTTINDCMLILFRVDTPNTYAVILQGVLEFPNTLDSFVKLPLINSVHQLENLIWAISVDDFQLNLSSLK